jgi:hypothetical protein
MLLLGLALGLVVGAGGVGLAWGLGSSGGGTDAEAVCGIVARTPDPPDDFRDLSIEYVRRWSISDVAESIAAADGTYRPLADALRGVVRSLRTLDPDEMRTSIADAREACDDL